MRVRIEHEDDAQRLLEAVCKQAAWDLRHGRNAGDARSFLKHMGLNEQQLNTITRRGKHGNSRHTQKPGG